MYIFSGWKMNLNVYESINYARMLNEYVNLNVKEEYGIKIGILPDFLSLYPILIEFKNSKISVGAQDCFWEDKGPYTGEISPMFLKEIGCKYVMIGHPERKIFLKEDGEMISRKIKACIRNDLLPLFPLIEPNTGLNRAVSIKSICEELMNQFINASKYVDISDINKIVILYEPLWAINTNNSASISHIKLIVKKIRHFINEIFGNGIGDKQVILYAGGLRPDTAKKVLTCKDIDGIGMGKSGLNYYYFTSVIKAAIKVVLKEN